jgi:predicted dehydrogenase
MVLQGGIFGGSVDESFLYGLPLEAGANLVTIPFGHAVDALCYVLGEVKDISATVANLQPEIDLIGADGKSKGKVEKTSHDYISISARLAEGGGVVSATYAPGNSRTGRNLYWEITGSEGSLVLENPNTFGGHVQMFQPTIKLATNEGIEEVKTETAADFSFAVGKAWDAWAGVGTDQGFSVTTWVSCKCSNCMEDKADFCELRMTRWFDTR